MFFILSRDTDNDTSNLTVFVPGHEKPLTADSTHPSFDKMVEGVKVGDPTVVNLFDVAATVARKFDKLSDRISAANGRLYLDGDEIVNALGKQILRFLDEGVDDWVPLVNFFEKVLANPNEHSREQLYVWLERHALTITDDGDMVAYKTVRKDGCSHRSGPAIVNGEEVNGHVPNPVGGIIEMQRSSVTHDPSVGCSVGLHVGTPTYCREFGSWQSGGSKYLEVSVNPRDVVSVPTDCNAQKVRVARYEVVREFESSDFGYTTAVRPAEAPIVPLDDYLFSGGL